MMFDVTLADIEAAAQRIKGRVRRTPLYVSPGLSHMLGVETSIKCESLQLHGSFKVRGCLNTLLQLSKAELARGVVTVSGGNHAIAVSATATALGTSALVLMPKAASPYNIELTKEAGGTVELCDDAAEAFAKADVYARDGRLNVHAYDDPRIIAGHGTVGLEIADDGGAFDHVFVSIGGGGFSAGVSAALKGHNAAQHIYGVETQGAETMTEALKTGVPVTIRPTSIARTLGAPFATQRTIAAAQQFLDDVVLVPDCGTVRAMVDILSRERLLVEPAAACTLAAALEKKPAFKSGDRVCLILCGSNVPLADLLTWRKQFHV